MNTWRSISGSGFLLGILVCLAGCGTTNPNVTKERGVYTTVAMTGENLDLPASGYTSCKTFGPSQTPAAVVVGYGVDDGPNNNRSQPFDLQVVEVASGTVVFNSSGSALAGKAAVIDLPIRKSGDYRLKLVINDSVYDTWDFSVNREGAAGVVTASNLPPVYAKGLFSTSIEEIPDAFSQYDESLIQALNDAVQKESSVTDHDVFAQVPPGRVVIRFDLTETGQISSSQIIQNTLNDALGQFFLHALKNGAPYRAWPQATREAFGKNSRSVKASFSYD